VGRYPGPNGDNQLRGLGVARGRIFRFPNDLRRRRYNTRTIVRVWYRLVTDKRTDRQMDTLRQQRLRYAVSRG